MMNSFFDLFKNIPGTIYSHDPDSTIGKLFQLYSDRFDELKSVVDELIVLKEIDSQSGQVLDEIGKIVREPRRGRSDEDYRSFLYIAIQRNISSGSLSTIAQITRLIIGENCDYEISELYSDQLGLFLDGNSLLDGSMLLNPYDPMPATFKVQISGDTSGLDEDFLKEVIKEIRGAGIAGLVEIL